MSIENAKAFYEKVKADQNLQQKIGQLLKEDPKGTEAIIIKVAKENGFEFTEAEMKAFIAEEVKKVNLNGELNENELESVAGGAKDDWIFNSLIIIGCIASAVDKKVHHRCNLDEENPKPF